MFIRSTPKDHIHLISFDIPVPVNYGGAIDVYYKLRALKNAGVKVHLHCYQYDRQPAEELRELCESVHYYRRNIAKTNLFRSRPYIVVTRSSEEMLLNLLQDHAPILFEGLHSCYFLDDRRLKKRKKIVRTHNIEHEYYSSLGKVEKNIFKRFYFFNESSKLKRYEEVLGHAQGIAAISKNDQAYFLQKFSNVQVVSAFHPHENIRIGDGMGDYALYHGSLDVGENNEAAIFLVDRVFGGLDIPLVIAGNKPSQDLKEAVRNHKNIRLEHGIGTQEIYDLVANAQINILPTFQATGIKLKLLTALYTGRHCIVNSPMVKETGLEELCHVADTADEMKAEVKRLFRKSFTAEEKNRREIILETNGFSNQHNVEHLLQLLFA